VLDGFVLIEIEDRFCFANSFRHGRAGGGSRG
jgi:hypothetical protein